jgi:hypothetical protein
MDGSEMTIDLDALESLAKAAPSGQWEVWTSNSWRRVLAVDGRDTVRVIEPTVQRHDNHPDLMFGPGVKDWLEGATPSAILELCAEVRRLRELLGSIPRTPEAAIAFIGSQFNSMRAQGWTETFPSEPTGDLSTVTYSLSVHDLLSAFSWAGLSGEDIDTALEKP